MKPCRGQTKRPHISKTPEYRRTNRGQPNANRPDPFSLESRTQTRPIASSSSSTVICQTDPATCVSVEEEKLWDNLEGNLVTKMLCCLEVLLDDYYVTLDSIEQDYYAAGRKKGQEFFK